jgi:hypothetical protein
MNQQHSPLKSLRRLAEETRVWSFWFEDGSTSEKKLQHMNANILHKCTECLHNRDHFWHLLWFEWLLYMIYSPLRSSTVLQVWSSTERVHKISLSSARLYKWFGGKPSDSLLVHGTRHMPTTIDSISTMVFWTHMNITKQSKDFTNTPEAFYSP